MGKNRGATKAQKGGRKVQSERPGPTAPAPLGGQVCTFTKKKNCPNETVLGTGDGGTQQTEKTKNVFQLKTNGQ